MILKYIYPSLDFKERISLQYDNITYNMKDLDSIAIKNNSRLTVSSLEFLILNNKFRTILKHLDGSTNFISWDEEHHILKYPLISTQKKITCAGKKMCFVNSFIPTENQLEIIKNIIRGGIFGIIEEVF